ncbi:GNAT family N-acetyltransferase [Halorussus litoreus]|uniref:GNAT family N-acetyltransferase n=1 Tax=Halorussus litoreus TaxID=1710536 RepID=UPI000E235ACA|nr:GNAT family N-acetyltransferase [Halorussus litoreus]
MTRFEYDELYLKASTNRTRTPPSNRDLVADAHDNLQRAFLKQAEHVPDGQTRQFGPVTAVSAGVPIPIFNRVFILECPPYDELTAAVEWMTQRDVPFWATVTTPMVKTVEELATGLDLRLTNQPQPGMALAPLDEIPSSESVAQISEVTDSDALADFATIAATVFEIPEDVTHKLTSPSILIDEEVRLFVGQVDDQSVACGQLVQTGDVAGIYTIGVVEPFRRQGIGEAMSCELLRIGRDAGCTVGTLQSSEMAQPMYEKIGFETVVTYHHFEATV